jgi:hypothetical protein
LFPLSACCQFLPVSVLSTDNAATGHIALGQSVITDGGNVTNLVIDVEFFRRELQKSENRYHLCLPSSYREVRWLVLD